MAAISSAYESSFDCEKYHRLFYTLDPSVAAPSELPAIKERLRFLHEFYSEVSPQDARFLEFGGGPTVYSLISVAPFTQSIVFTDISEAALGEIRRWKEQQPDALNFTSLFTYVVEELEGKSEEEAKRREDRLRPLITELIRCDMRQPSPLFDGSYKSQFDIVSVHFCLCCSESTDEYAAHVKRLADLIRPGGYLLLSDCLEETVCTFQEEKIPRPLFLTREGLLGSIRNAGLEVLKEKMVYTQEGDEITDSTQQLLVAAQKRVI
ncbi:nicotinamide N-methyltransferase-like [Corticium candelabrum]|uniref:nicotinamide N-methyltransferase-like n=1 Tax=Corticium candelabrum TaxID=121492 RepID=UPI002E26E740|nr:nicotinamide N-methyltransferase-like [Corticium candelabrum]